MKIISKKTIIIFVLIITIFTLIGCSSSKSDSTYNSESTKGNVSSDYAGNSKPDTADGSYDPSISNDKMIYRSSVSIETLEFDKTVLDVNEFVKSLGGYIERSSISGIGNSLTEPSNIKAYAEITFRIPIANYNNFMENIDQYGNVVSNNTSQENITSQYYDIQGRLSAYKISEKRLLEILAKADTVTDMLEIERELANVRANIESMTTQIKSWDSLIEYSTVTVTIREVRKITDNTEPTNFAERVWQTIKNSVTGFFDFIKEALIVIVYLIPYVILLGIILIIVLKFRKKK